MNYRDSNMEGERSPRPQRAAIQPAQGKFEKEYFYAIYITRPKNSS
jgi:hypothetical protein